MRTGLFLMLALLLGACSGGSESGEKTEAPWDAQLELKDRAEQANKLIEKSAQDARKAIEEQTR